jgi:hypothetical protein
MDAQGGESAGVEDGFAAVVVGVPDGGSGKQVKVQSLMDIPPVPRSSAGQRQPLERVDRRDPRRYRRDHVGWQASHQPVLIKQERVQQRDNAPALVLPPRRIPLPARPLPPRIPSMAPVRTLVAHIQT